MKAWKTQIQLTTRVSLVLFKNCLGFQKIGVSVIYNSLFETDKFTNKLVREEERDLPDLSETTDE